MRLSQIERLTPLSPIQQGLLFHVLAEPESGLYIEHAICQIDGPLDVAVLRRVWQQLVDRHDALRAAILWRGLEAPTQVFYRGVQPTLACWDAGDEDAGPWTEDRVKEHAQLAGALDTPPLMRLALRRTGPHEHHLVWSIHHLVHDAWSLSILLNELIALYEAEVEGRAALLPRAGSFGEFVTWAAARRPAGAERFWRTALDGHDTRPCLPAGRNGATASAVTVGATHDRVICTLDGGAGARGFTLNTYAAAAYAVALAAAPGAQNSRTDVLFGAAAAGRPVDYPHIASTVGVFINMLPFRVRLDPSLRVDAWLRQVQQQQLATLEHETTPLSEIGAWLGATRDRPLFESILVCQNALESFERRQMGPVCISSVRSSGHPHYPLMCRVTPGAPVLLEIVFDTRRIARATATRLLDRVHAALLRLLASGDALLGDVRRQLDRESFSGRTSVMTEPRRIGGARPRPRSLDGDTRFVESPFAEGQAFPPVMRPATPGLDPVAAAARQREPLRQRLLDAGALLFRDCGIESAARFEAFVAAIAGEGMHYTERSSPRSSVGGHVYTSTDYPADQPILPHNENSYAHQWPMTVAFYCDTPAEAGGETPITDVRRVLSRLSEPVRDGFARRGVCYVRNYAPGLGLPWPQVFQTERRDEVERFCAEAGYQVEWRDGERLRTRRVAPAVRRHPRTGEALWFNHALFFHVTSLPAAARDVLLARFGEDDWPYHTCFGDGAPIPTDWLDDIRAAYEAETVSFPWQKGDVLLLDNMLVAHARAPYRGARRVLVCMTEPHRDDERFQSEGIAS